MKETLAEMLLRLRQEAALTQAGLAERAGLSIHNVRNYERGSRTPSLAAAYKLAKALGASVEEFAQHAILGEVLPAEDSKVKRSGRKRSK
jgi:transcriptional regulator with XRE-family HTH domain